MTTNRYRHDRVLGGLEHAWRVLRDYVPQTEAADLVLTLFFWLYHSREWAAERERLRRHYRKYFSRPTKTPDAGADGVADEAANRGPFRFDDSSSWLALAGHKGQDGNALFLALEVFCAHQSRPDVMRAMLRPARFATGSRHFDEGDQTPLLAEVLHRLGQIDFGFCRTEAPLNIPLLFAAAYQTVQADGPLPAQATLSLMAQLLAPRHGESVLDPACASGQALAACTRTASGALGGLRPRLTGHAPDPAQLALAHMLLLTHRNDQFTLAPPPSAEAPDGAVQQADVIVLDQVVASAAREAPDMLRWLAPAAVQLTANGRMALAVTADWLRHVASLPLRTQLVQRGWLDAVAWLPQQSDEATAVLLLRPGQQQRTVRVLAHAVPGDCGDWDETRGQPGVHQLIWAYQYACQGAGRAPWLHEREAAALVQQQYRLDGGKGD
jgi:hypothetical protein